MLLLANNYAVVNVSDENSVCVITVKWMSGEISNGAKVVVTWTNRKQYSAEMLALGMLIAYCFNLKLQILILCLYRWSVTVCVGMAGECNPKQDFMLVIITLFCDQ